MKVILAFTGLFLSLRILAQQQESRDTAVYYSSEGRFSKVFLFSKKNFEAVKDISNEDAAYISAATSLGNSYYSLLKFDSALSYFLKAVEGANKRYGPTSVQYGRLLVNVAASYMELGQYQEAGQKFQDATAVLTRLDSSCCKNAFVLCLTQYAGFYLTTGNLNKAEELCLNARKIALRAPVDTAGYIAVLDKLSWLYEKLGFYSKQEEIAIRIVGLERSVNGEGTVRYANAIASLGGLHQRHHNLKQADSMYRKALQLKRQIFGERSPANIAVLNHIGIVNMEMGKFREAEKYLKEAAEIAGKNMGEGSPLYAYCVKNLARFYVLSGRKGLAAPLFQKCLAVYEGMGLEFNVGRLNLLHDMAELLYAGDPAKAALYLKEAMETENKLLLQKLDFLSEKELLAYLKRSRDASESPYRFLLSNKSPAIVSAAYNSRLLASGIGLQNTRTLYQNMAQSKDSTLATLWKNYLRQKSFYITLLLTPAAQRNADVDSVAAALNRQEKDILRGSADYRNMKEKLAFTWQDVQKHLQANEAAVEFVRFNYTFNPYTKAKADSVYYAALLLRPQDTAPQFVVLCEEKQLIAAIKKFPYRSAGNTRGGEQTKYGQSATNALYRLVWRPLEPYLAHAGTVYFSPDYILHRVAFSAIPCKKGMLLCDKYKLIQLTSTRQIALQETRPLAPVSIAMFGGINYNRQSADTCSRFYARLYRGDRGVDRDSFPFLPNTLEEINTIKTDAEALQKHLVVFTADNATEAAFRSLAGDKSPEVIHFATHGFTLADTNVQKGAGASSFSASDDPLLRCGLVMAGGNNGWTGRAGLNEDDGILTGLEISSIQLPNTELAVLSACETGLGKIEGSEGVFGLQRAFKLAGVNYVMASLWQVPDKETSEFMEIFYAHWLGGKTIRQAFFNTQQTMRKKYTPYYWAAFTLVQ